MALADAELRRALLRQQTRLVLGGALAATVVAAGFWVALDSRITARGAHEIVGAVRTVLPLAACVLGALYTGAWCGSGTAALVALWSPRRVRTALVEIGTAATTTGLVVAVGWAVFALALAAWVRHSSGEAGAFIDLDLATLWMVPASTALAATLGAAVGVIAAGAAGAVAVVVGAFWFGEPLVDVAVRRWLDEGVVWLHPASALLGLADLRTSLYPEGAPSPWAAAVLWAAATTALAALVHHRRDLG